jgi:2-dehydropantoate 2-reductase
MKRSQTYHGINLFPTSQKFHDKNASMTDHRRIHVLGIGNLGRFFAHGLATSPNPPPITLLLRQSSLVQWEKEGRQISITTNGITSSSGGFEVESVTNRSISSSDAPISNLIVATKATGTVEALKQISHRLNSSSTILFTQNGIGTIDGATSQVFKDVHTRPSYLTCVVSHALYSTGTFSSVYAGLGTISIGCVHETPYSNPQYLIEKIVSVPILAATEYPQTELLYLQLEKLVMNAMINPLTAILDCKNGELFCKGPVMKVMRLLLQEAVQVLQSLPEIRDSTEPEIQGCFSIQKLGQKVVDIAQKTAENTSSMLQDVRAGKETEIDYINGWIVEKGKAFGVECDYNAKLLDMVKSGQKIGTDEIRDHFDLEDKFSVDSRGMQ